MTEVTTEAVLELTGVLERAQKGVTLRPKYDDQDVAFIVPEGHTLEIVKADESRRDFPYAKRGQVLFGDPASFVQYVKDHGEDARTSLYREVETGEFVAVLDGHTRGADVAGWGRHRALLSLRASEEWLAWSNASGSLKSQEQFAEFLEDRAGDIHQPDAATMLELARTFEATRGAEFRSAVRLDSGDRQLVFKETTEARAGQNGQLVIPERVVLALRPWATSTAPFQVQARFRYRITDGKLSMGVVLDRPDLVLRVALEEVTAEIAEALELPALLVHKLP